MCARAMKSPLHAMMSLDICWARGVWNTAKVLVITLKGSNGSSAGALCAGGGGGAVKAKGAFCTLAGNWGAEGARGLGALVVAWGAGGMWERGVEGAPAFKVVLRGGGGEISFPIRGGMG